MNISGVAKNVAKQGLKIANTTGEAARKVVHAGVNKVTKKSDEFVKTTDRLNKDTGIGSAIILGAVGAATACVKGIVDKVKEVKEK